MTATQTPAGTIHYGWEVYRRSQQVPFPAWGALELLKAQSRLFRLAEPFASGRARDHDPDAVPDLDGISKAAGDLIGAVARYCDQGNAAFVSGQDGSAAA